MQNGNKQTIANLVIELNNAEIENGVGESLPARRAIDSRVATASTAREVCEDAERTPWLAPRGSAMEVPQTGMEPIR